MNHLLNQLGKVLPSTNNNSKRDLDLESNDKNGSISLLTKGSLNQDISLIHNVLCEWLGVQIYNPSQGMKLILQHRKYRFDVWKMMERKSKGQY